jgi:uncharacterized delta-60 repeat protein
VFLGGAFNSAPGPLIPSSLATTTQQDFFTKIEPLGIPVAPGFFAGSGFNGPVYDISHQADGKILVAGGFTSFDTNVGTVTAMARLNTNGTLDTAFSSLTPTITNPGMIRIMRAQAPDINGKQKILVGGLFSATDNSVGANYLMRLNSDGSLDATSSFHTVLTNSPTDAVVDLELMNDGRVLIVANQKVIRTDVNGVIDPTFNSPVFSYTISGIGVQSNGDVIIGTPQTARKITRLLAIDGSVDPNFNFGGVGGGGVMNPDVVSIAVLPDDKILFISQWGGTYNGTALSANMARLNADGTLDPTFNLRPAVVGNGVVAESTGGPSYIAVYPDGRILVSIAFAYTRPIVGLITGWGVWRFLSDGLQDLTYIWQDQNLNNTMAISIDSNEKIVLGGNFFKQRGVPKGYINRVIQNGDADTY